MIGKLSLTAFVALVLLAATPAASQTASVAIGPEITVIQDGDFVHPRLSPDGRRVAYSRVVVEKGTELCEVRVRNLETRVTKTLLTVRQSRGYAVYAAFVTDLQWLDNNRLRAGIADGDVDQTLLTYDVRTGRILKREYSGGDDFDNESLVNPELRFAVPLIREISPDLGNEVVFSALQSGNGAFAVGRERIVLQHNYSGYPDDVLIYDLKKKTVRTAWRAAAENKRRPMLLGGFGLPELTVFVVGAGDRAEIFEDRGDGARLAKTQALSDPESDSPRFEVLARSPAQTVFFVGPQRTNSKMAGALWSFSNSGIEAIDSGCELVDADVGAGRIALLCRRDPARSIRVAWFNPK